MSKSGIRVIVHATDFSPTSRAAFTKAVQLARVAGAQLVLLHVRSPVASLVADAYVAPQEYEQLNRASFDAAKKQITRLVETAKRRGLFFLGSVAGRVASMASCPVLTVRGTFRLQ